MDVPKYTLFKPTKINLLREYPELKDYPEFNTVSSSEMNFVWYAANETSPLAEKNEKERRKKAYKLAFGDTGDTKQLKFIEGDYPPHIRAAIDRMKTFKPSARMRAKLMVEKNFEDFETIIHKDLSTIISAEELKKYAELKLKIAKDLPDLIKLMEQGFGINEVEEIRDSGKREASYADSIHEDMAKAAK